MRRSTRFVEGAAVQVALGESAAHLLDQLGVGAGLDAGGDHIDVEVASELHDATRCLLDPRVGRGFYSSFDSRFFFLRWPLDHLFHDARFRVVDLQRLDNVGSDHFPMYFALELNGTAAQGEEVAEASEDDQAELREMTEREAARDRRPVGEDWE